MRGWGKSREGQLRVAGIRDSRKMESNVVLSLGFKPCLLVTSKCGPLELEQSAGLEKQERTRGEQKLTDFHETSVKPLAILSFGMS